MTARRDKHVNLCPSWKRMRFKRRKGRTAVVVGYKGKVSAIVPLVLDTDGSVRRNRQPPSPRRLSGPKTKRRTSTERRQCTSQAIQEHQYTQQNLDHVVRMRCVEVRKGERGRGEPEAACDERRDDAARNLKFVRSRRTWDAESRELREKKRRPSPSSSFLVCSGEQLLVTMTLGFLRRAENVSPDHLPAHSISRMVLMESQREGNGPVCPACPPRCHLPSCSQRQESLSAHQGIAIKEISAQERMYSRGGEKKVESVQNGGKRRKGVVPFEKRDEED